MSITAAERDALLTTARAASANAYAPYSNYPVGAAILAADGRIFSGANVENASYGLSNCAERTAVFTMVSTGVRAIRAVAVHTRNGGSPCGACRQVLSEFSGDVPVLLIDDEGQVQETTLGELLPLSFGGDQLA